MHLHLNGTEIGDALFVESGNYYHFKINLQSDVEHMTPGRHGLHVHEHEVGPGFNCSAAGPHFNPDGSSHGGVASKKGERHVGDFGNVRAGKRGEVDYLGEIVVDVWSPENVQSVTEPVSACVPYFEQIWEDGSRRRMEPDKVKKMMNWKKNKGQGKGSTEKQKKRKKRKGLDSYIRRKLSSRRNSKPKKKKTDLASDQKFEIVKKDCYQQRWLHENWSVHDTKFTLTGEQSIVNRAVVIHEDMDDSAKRHGMATSETGGAGEPIACCTLRLL